MHWKIRGGFIYIGFLSLDENSRNTVTEVLPRQTISSKEVVRFALTSLCQILNVMQQDHLHRQVDEHLARTRLLHIESMAAAAKISSSRLFVSVVSTFAAHPFVVRLPMLHLVK